MAELEDVRRANLAIARAKAYKKALDRQIWEFGTLDGEPIAKLTVANGTSTIIDLEDYAKVSQFVWTCSKKYIVRIENGKKIYLHKYLMNTPDNMQCDHKYNDTFDNRKSRLRNCTPMQNNANASKRSGTSSRFKGVT